MSDQICFPDRTSVPFNSSPPTIDGYVEPEPAMLWDFGAVAANVDVGWTGSGKQTFGDAVDAGLGTPLVVFQGIKEGGSDFMYLSFIVRRDTIFSDDDVIVVVLHPDFATGSLAKDGSERRIHIWPLEEAQGAPTDAGHTDVDADTWGITDSASGFKTDRLPRNTTYYEWNTAGSGSWDQITAPTGAEIRVRSWDGGVNQKNWSVEVKLPTSTAAGGAGWIDLTGNFGLYVNVIRAYAPSQPAIDNWAAQFVWPLGGELDDTDPATGLPTLALEQIAIEPALLGEAVLGGSTCAGVNGVKFDGGYYSIGAREAGTAGAPGSFIDATVANEFVAKVLNDDSAAANELRAEFRIANWGIGPGSFEKWNRIPADPGFNNPSDPQDLAGTPNPAVPTTTELTTQWTLDPLTEVPLYGTTLDDHQCIWVQLSSDQTVSFVRSSRVRNMNLTGLSSHEQDASISGIQDAEEPGDLDFILVSSQQAVARQIERGERPQRDRGRRDDRRRVAGQDDATARIDDDVRRMIVKPDPAANYRTAFIQINDGYWRTPKTITLGTTKYQVYRYSDSFGQTGVHDSVQPAALDYSMAGPGLATHGRGLYSIRVPRDGEVRLNTRMATRPLRPEEAPKGCMPTLLAWLRSLRGGGG